MLGILNPFGVDFFCLGKKFLVFNLLSRNLKIKYRRSVLGLFWTLLSPLANAAIYYFVFKVVLKVQIPHYLAFILGGVLPWAFFSQTISEGMEAIVGNHGLISKVPMPLQAFPFVGALTNLVTLVLALPVLIGVALLSHAPIGLSIISLPVLFLALFLVAYGTSIILAIAFVYLRDLKHIVQIVIQIWFYATPVVYTEQMIPERFRWIVPLNPVGLIFSGIHSVLVDGSWPASRVLLGIALWVSLTVSFAAYIQSSCTGELVEQI